MFGRELFFRSLKTMVQVLDTPRGVLPEKIVWCKQPTPALPGLRHALYNNPDALENVVAYISGVAQTRL